MANAFLSNDAVSLYVRLVLHRQAGSMHEAAYTASMDELKAMGLVSHGRGPSAAVILASPEEAFDRMLSVARERAGQAVSGLTWLLEAMDVLERQRWAAPMPDDWTVEVLDGAASIAQATERLMIKAAGEFLAVIVNGRLPLGWLRELDRLSGFAPGRARLLWTREAYIAIPGAESRITTADTTQLDARIAGGREALVACPEQPGTALLVRSPGVVTLLRSWFEAMWERGAPAQPMAEPTWPYRQRILALLASGYRDAEVARSTGTSIRTVRRHMAEMMRVTGASTRFQVGLEASRRGLVSQGEASAGPSGHAGGGPGSATAQPG